MTSVRILRLLGVSVVLAACGADPSAPNEDDVDGDGVRYEDDSSTADELVQTHAIVELKATTNTLAVRTLDARVPALRGFTAAALEAERSVAVLRSARIDGASARVVVDVESLVTSVVAADALEQNSHDAGDLDAAWLEARANQERHGAAFTTLADAESDDGAERVSMTIDMCQSSRAWEKRFYDELTSIGQALGKPLPVGVAMTGGWARAHSTELADLRRRNGTSLAIEWVNHSNTHPLHCTDSSQRVCKFLTDDSVSMSAEVLGLETVLLSIGEVPGALFRFPGLIHDARRLGELNDLGLFALDADAWLAKGQAPHPGAVILVHGNGNEVPGIQKAMTWLREHRADLEAGRIRMVAPRAVVAH